MDQSVYEAEAQVESFHWWFEGRRQLFARMLDHYAVPKTGRILDAGTGTGANLGMLREDGFSNTVGLDFSEDAVRFCAAKGLSVQQGSLTDLPLETETFDFCFATDVIEHIDDDAKALEEIARVLKPGGKVLVTVPAFRSLWGYNDDRAHHKRRYRLGELRSRIEAAGLSVRDIFYFNYILFLPIWLARRLLRASGEKAKNESELNSPNLNAILLRLFRLDTWTAQRFHPPFGVSILAVGEKTGPSEPAAPGNLGRASASTPPDLHSNRTHVVS